MFSGEKPIYLQMADRLCDEILAGKYQDDDRIPSVREYAVMLEVNANTAVKAYDELARLVRTLSTISGEWAIMSLPELSNRFCKRGRRLSSRNIFRNSSDRCDCLVST